MVQTRGQTARNKAARSGNRPPSFTKNGPSALKPLSSSRKRTRKQKKDELTFWPFEDLFTSPHKPTARVTKTRAMGKDKAEKTATSGSSKPSAANKNGTMAASKVQKTPAAGLTKPAVAIQVGAMATSEIQGAAKKAGEATNKAKAANKTPAVSSTLPKELIQQHTLSVTPQAGTDMEELEEAIRNIESPCGNIVWSKSWIKQRTQGSGPTTLEINIIHNDCSRHRRPIPYSCRKNRITYGATNWDLPPHGEALSIEDVVRHVRDMDDLVAACETVAWRSWAVNAVSHGGNWQAS